MTNETKTALMEWLQNIADNYNHDRGSIYAQLLDVCNALGLSKRKMDKRWQYFSVGDDTTAERLYQCLFSN